ncbi:MAG: DeoR family transcriptional regulator [Candidatus Nealsonbacteria bacterium]|nr:DeoR family transcriptional regulator [Candidatus Nealsonbacteria bacterium]
MRQNLDKEHLLKLTLAVYKVTALFPVGEDLASKIRELADRIMVESYENISRQDEMCSRKITEIFGLFDLAKQNNWVDSRNFEVLRREYNKLSQLCQTSDVGQHDSGKTVDNYLPTEALAKAGRQEKIIAYINGNGRFRIGDVVGLFPEINRRTVLRDLDKLCQTGIMVRNGAGRGVYYVKNGTH